LASYLGKEKNESCSWPRSIHPQYLK
jgi:hypothetical protein